MRLLPTILQQLVIPPVAYKMDGSGRASLPFLNSLTIIVVTAVVVLTLSCCDKLQLVFLLSRKPF